MATIDYSELDHFAFDFNELAKLPDEVVEDMLKAEAEVIKKGQSSTAQSMLQGPYNKGAVEKAVKVGKVKRSGNGKSVYVTFEGSQHKTRLAEIAFLNEFGKKGQPARQFIRTANERYADEAVDAATKIYDQHLSKHGF